MVICPKGCQRGFRYQFQLEEHLEKQHHFTCQKSGKVFGSRMEDGPEFCPCCKVYTWNNPEGVGTGEILQGINGCLPIQEKKLRVKYPMPGKRQEELVRMPGFGHTIISYQV